MATTTPRTIAVVGTGALGGFVGAHLAKAGQSVHFLVRSDYEALKRSGFQIQMADTPDFTVPHPAVYKSSAEIGPVDLVLIALKTTQNKRLPELLQPLVAAHTQLFSIQNGLGNIEFLQTIYPQNTILGGLCQIGVDREAPGRLVSYVKGAGSIQVGAGYNAQFADVENITQLLNASGLKTRSLKSLGEAQWRKLMWNVPFNGLTVAIGGQTTDAVVGNTHLRKLCAALMHELQQAATKLSFEIEPDYADKLIRFTDDIGAYPPSSLIDWRPKRPLEVEAIWGEPLRQGEKAGVPMPHLKTLYAILAGLNATITEEQST